MAIALTACANAPAQAPSAAHEKAAPRPTPAFSIVSVEQWGGEPLSAAMRERAKAHVPTRLTIHHAGVPFGRDKDPVAHLINLQKWSRGTRGWADIPYHLVIDLDGKVYQARDLMLAGDTNTNYDPSGHALVMLLGNFEEAEPTPAQIDALVQSMAHLSKRFNIPAQTLASHKDHAAGTSCPGKHLYAYLQSGELLKRLNAELASPHVSP